MHCLEARKQQGNCLDYCDRTGNSIDNLSESCQCAQKWKMVVNEIILAGDHGSNLKRGDQFSVSSQHVRAFGSKIFCLRRNHVCPAFPLCVFASSGCTSYLASLRTRVFQKKRGMSLSVWKPSMVFEALSQHWIACPSIGSRTILP